MSPWLLLSYLNGLVDRFQTILCLNLTTIRNHYFSLVRVLRIVTVCLMVRWCGDLALIYRLFDWRLYDDSVLWMFDIGRDYCGFVAICGPPLPAQTALLLRRFELASCCLGRWPRLASYTEC